MSTQRHRRSAPSCPSRLRVAATCRAIVVLAAAGLAAPAVATQDLLITGARVLSSDGERFRDGLAIVIQGGHITTIAPADTVAVAPTTPHVDARGLWVVPGLVDLHTHLLLHPYDETSWNDQVLTESLELRTIRATVAARSTLAAGFTTIRELGTEGAAFADVALRDAIASGMIPGPRVFAATRALVATGCYGPSGFDPRWDVPKGAQVADGVDGVRKAVREQVAAGADWIKVYADYARRPGAPATPAFTQAELEAIVDEATTARCPVAAHATSDAAIHRAVAAGVRTIEHGYNASDEALRQMRDRGVVLCPTLAANEAMVRYGGGSPGIASRLSLARVTFQRALAAGVTIACGSDAGVFRHGDNAREIELMVEYGMTPAQALRAATSVAAGVIGLDRELGVVDEGRRADLVLVAGDPLAAPSALRRVALVVRGGTIAIDRR